MSSWFPLRHFLLSCNAHWNTSQGSECAAPGPKAKEHLADDRARVLDTDELVDFLQARTQEAVDKRSNTSPDAYQVVIFFVHVVQAAIGCDSFTQSVNKSNPQYAFSQTCCIGFMLTCTS